MPSSKKNKVKKQSPDLPPPPVSNQGDDNDNLVDDLFAQLDSRDETLQLYDLPTISVPPPPVLNQADDNECLVDNLLAQLDSRDQTLQLYDLTISDSAATPVQKQDGKSRFKARQVLKLGSLQAKFLTNVQIVGKEGCSTCPNLL
jgi:hypothetical protein